MSIIWTCAMAGEHTMNKATASNVLYKANFLIISMVFIQYFSNADF
jgi:hypothetical protein